MTTRARHRQPARSALRKVLLVTAGDFLRAALRLMRLAGSAPSLRRLAHNVLLRRALLRLAGGRFLPCHFDNLLWFRAPTESGLLHIGTPKKAKQPVNGSSQLLVQRRRDANCVACGADWRPQVADIGGVEATCVASKARTYSDIEKTGQAKSFPDKQFRVGDWPQIEQRLSDGEPKRRPAPPRALDFPAAKSDIRTRSASFAASPFLG
jgi:hypothetical protein